MSNITNETKFINKCRAFAGQHADDYVDTINATIETVELVTSILSGRD